MPRKNLYPTHEEARKAAQKHGFTSREDYYKNAKTKDERLPINPNEFYKNDWVDWYDFLGKKRPVALYPTYKEARKATQKHGFTSREDYNKNAQIKDERLPASPEKTYKNDWVDWYDFLGKKRPVALYPTYIEARKAAQKHAFTSSDDYKKNAQIKDERLPINPNEFYKNDWVDWYDFLGSERPIILYPTYKEARKPTQKHGFTGREDYNKNAQTKDERLPASPEKTYKNDWVDWYDYLGNRYPLIDLRDRLKKEGITTFKAYQMLAKNNSAFPAEPVKLFKLKSFKSLVEFEYWDVKKTRAYVQKHKIKTFQEYTEHAKQNPYLRAHTSKIVGYTNAKDFYYQPDDFEVIQAQHPEIKPYIEVAKRYCKKGVNLSKKTYILRRFISDYIIALGQPAEPAKFLLATYKAPSIDIFINMLSDSDKSTNSLRIVNEYIELLLKTYCADEDEDTGEILYLEGFRNPFAKHELEEVYKARNTETDKPILPHSYIQKAANYLFPADAKTFTDATQAIKLYDCDYFEVSPSFIDKSDPNCIWRTKEVYKTRGRNKDVIYEVWSPVRAVALYTLHKLPLRGQQILWNDSGEADAEIPVIEEGKLKWVKNTHMLAGQFKESQGFIKKQDNDGFGFYATTNKTKSGEGGYSAPYMPPELAYWLIQLRDWQMKYNPIDAPASWHDEIKNKPNHRIDKKRLSHRGFKGEQCFLFRNPAEKTPLHRSLSLATTCIKNGLSILYFFIQDEVLPLAERISESEDKVYQITNYKSPYTAHCLRASLITAYILDYELSPAIVAKLVGHASIVMSIYYVKVAEKEIRQKLNEAEEKALSRSRDRVDYALFEQTLKNMTPLFVDNAQGAMLDALNSDNGTLSASRMVFDFGICPYAASRCDEGGETISEKHTSHHPVPAGYLGRQNCPQCRFFVTGAPFLGGLKALADEISLEAKIASGRMDDTLEEIQSLEDKWVELGDGFTEQAKLKQCRDIYQQQATKFDTLTVDLVHVFRLASDVKALLNNQSESESADNLPMIANQDVQIDIGIEEVSAFHHLDTICKSTELYRSVDASRAIPTRTQMLDSMAHWNDIKSHIFTLNEKQQLKVGNQMTRLLLDRLGSWEKLDKVMRLENPLRDFIKPTELKKIKRDIKLMAGTSVPGIKIIDGGIDD